MVLRDVQNERDARNIYLKRVGVKGVRYPVVVLDRAQGTQATIATINMYVDLPKDYRGTHMSRFIEVLNEFHLEINPKRVKDILNRLKDVLNAKRAVIEVEFPYFVKKQAPVTKSESYLEYTCSFEAEIFDGKFDFLTSVLVPIHTLCPCSKEISERGAHNQRALCKVSFESKEMIWIEDIIEVVEKSASAPIFTLLKRPDEKYVTELAYDNPKFVEDVARDVAIELKKYDKIKWYKVEVESYESIHAHNAYACVTSDELEEQI
ncbi:GTP cyclohydrolase I FolE2 [Fervidobacterium islandicum]|uniref:GTP cyclohydrolase FolE2 n=1 Tax=Fervidobacterium islandicum TaxID=2423 RepID=UPI003A6E00E9